MPAPARKHASDSRRQTLRAGAWAGASLAAIAVAGHFVVPGADVVCLALVVLAVAAPMQILLLERRADRSQEERRPRR